MFLLDFESACLLTSSEPYITLWIEVKSSVDMRLSVGPLPAKLRPKLESKPMPMSMSSP